MKPEEMQAYIAEQLVTIDRDEQTARQDLQAAQQKLVGLAYARRAYQDMANELGRRQQLLEEAGAHGLDHTINVG